jgi:uncharacterized membrane protein
VSWSDWLLSFHVLSAFFLVGGVVAIASLNVAAVRRERPSETALLLRLARIPEAAIGIGSIGALVFGIWLAIEYDAYSITDGWIIAAIVLWLVMGGLGGQGGKRVKAYRVGAERLAAGDDVATPELRARLRDPVTVAFNAGSGLATLLILIDMIWKPGA